MKVKVNMDGYEAIPSNCPPELSLGIDGSGATDYDGNTYTSIVLGTQDWLLQNLRVTHYNDGTPIPFANSDASWNQYDDWDDGSVGTYSYVNKTADTSTSEGLIYNRYACTGQLDISGGWRLPTQSDVSILKEYVGSSYPSLFINDNSWSDNMVPCSLNSSGLSLTGSGRRYLTTIVDRSESALYMTSQNFSDQEYVQYMSVVPFVGINYIHTNDLPDNNGMTVRLLRSKPYIISAVVQLTSSIDVQFNEVIDTDNLIASRVTLTANGSEDVNGYSINWYGNDKTLIRFGLNRSATSGDVFTFSYTYSDGYGPRSLASKLYLQEYTNYPVTNLL